MRIHTFSRLLVTAAFAATIGCASSQETHPGNPVTADILVPEMEQVFSETQGMISHTMTVLGHASEIQAREGGNQTVVRASAILHDIGIPRAREVHGSSSGQYQEIEGPPIAREILTRHDFPSDQIDHICGIVANHHSDEDPQFVNSLEFKILWDADWLVNFPRRHRDSSVAEKAEAIDEIFKTTRGKELAREMFLN